MSSNSRSDQNGAAVPSWDEFNMMGHEEEPNGNQEELEDEADYEEVVNEPGQPEEFGPSLPPGFGGEDSQGEPQPAGNELLNDFSIPTENYELDDPEDPLQGCSNSSNGSQRQPGAGIIGPQIPSSMALPKIAMQKSDEHLLPSIGHAVPSPMVSDFIPGDQPSCSSGSGGLGGHGMQIGPALPPDLLIPSGSGSGGNEEPKGFANVDELDDIGPALPPDEPQCSNSSTIYSFHYQLDGPSSSNAHKPQRRSQERGGPQIGPTLPSSSDEEEEEADNGRDSGNNGEQNGQGEEEDGEEDALIGPMPPAPGRSEQEEQAEYLARLAQFEANKQAKASNGLKREEWMTELPQKMLKTGAFGLTANVKTSFSRSTAGPSSSSADTSAWTSVPNGNGGQKTEKPSTSAAPSTSKKRPEQDEWEEQRANELNKDRNESLMDQHQKKRKLDPANAPSGSLLKTNTGERRAFNRDTDMEVRGLGGTDASALKERMGDLSNRFGHNSEKKFL